jgi:hypothetical protein
MAVELCGRRAAMAKDGSDSHTPIGEKDAQRYDRLAPVSNAVGGAILGTAFAGVIGALVGGVVGAGMPYVIRLLTGHN